REFGLSHADRAAVLLRLAQRFRGPAVVAAEGDRLDYLPVDVPLADGSFPVCSAARLTFGRPT
ncbi:hypothetical protein J7S33_07065, partial [Saccharothrix algeriensis]